MGDPLFKVIASGLLKVLRGVLALLYALLIGVYLLIVRTFLYAVTLYAVLYFALASTPARDAITQAVSGVIPGVLTTSTIQWGPFPSSLVLCDVAIQNEHNEHTIRVGALQTEIDLTGMVSGLTAFALLPSAPLPVLFRSATFVDADVKMRIDEEGRIDLIRAFHIRRLDEKPGPPANNRIIIANAKFINARYRLETENIDLDVRGADINLEHFRVERKDDFSFRVSQLNAQRTELGLKPDLLPVSSLERLTIPFDNVDIRDFQFDIHRFHARRAQSVVDGGTLDATLSMNFVDGPTPLWDLNAAVSLPETSRILTKLSGHVAKGDLQATLRALGSMRDMQATFDVKSDNLEVAGYALEDVTLSGGLRPAISPDHRLNHPIFIERLEARAFGGKIMLSPGTLIPRWATSGGLSSRGDRIAGVGMLGAFGGRLEVEGIDPALLTAPFESGGVPLLPSALIRSRIDGVLNVNGYIDEYSGGVRVDLESEALKIGLAEPIFGLNLGRPIILSGAVGYEQGPNGHGPPVGGQFRRTHLLELSELELKQGGDSIEVDANLDLEEEAIDLWGRVDLPGLKRLLVALGIEDISGQARVTGLRISGPWLNPRIQGKVKVNKALIYKQDGGDIEASVDIRGGLLKINSVATRASWGRASASGQIRLWRDRLDRLDSRMAFTARNVLVRELQLDNLMPEIGISARVSVKADRIDGEATRLLDTVEGFGTVRATDVKLGVDEAAEIIANLEANARSVRAKDVRVTLVSGDELKGSLTFHKDRQRLTAQLQTDALPFTSIRYFDHAGIPLRGEVTSSLALEGTLDDPVIIGTVAFQDLAMEPLKLGSGSFNIIPSGNGRLDFVAEEGRDLPGLKLLEDSYMTFVDGAPERIVFRIEAQDANVYNNLPFMEIPDTALTASGFVEVTLNPRDEHQAWSVVVDAAPNRVRLTTLSDDLTYTNLSELFVSIDPKGLFIAPFGVGRNSSDAMSVCGTYDETSAWDLHLSGKLSLDLIGPLRDLFSVSEGYLTVGEDKETALAIGDERCLPQTDDRLLRVTGELSSPIISGRLAFEEVVLVPRSLSRELRLVDEPSVLIRPGKLPGQQRLELNSANSDKMMIQVDDGSMELSGFLELQDLSFSSANLRAVGTDLFYNAIGEYRLSFNPDLNLKVANFQNDEERSLHLSGKVQVTEGVYYKSFDSFGQAFVGGGDVADTSVPLVETIPWLKALTIDLNVFGESFQVTSDYTGGEADIDTSFNLQVLGTLEDLRVEDRVVVQPGGTLTYDLIGREFEVVRGTLDFRGEAMRPSTDVELTTEVSYEVQSSNEDLAEERVVNVSVGITGVLPNLVIAFWSRDAVGLDQADLQSLILTGRPRDDAASLQNSLGISFDFGSLLSNVIQAPLFEAFKARVGPQGTVTTQIVTEFGRAVRLHAKVTQAAEETHVLAGFKFLLSDNLSLEGSLQRTDRALNPTQTYEARFKYRIPLD